MRPPVSGILNVNKPYGMTSYAVVAVIKRLSGERRVGHAGTLDPLATGVLPVCLGQGTRIVEFLMDATKTYEATIELGAATDTYDAAGKVTQTGDISGFTIADLTSTLASFRGEIEQVPPAYSALKYRGQPLYKLARAGIKVSPQKRPARIYELALVDWQPPLATVTVVCGKGTYIRSLAHDWGQVLGCGAHLKGLVRSRYGVFEIADAVPMTGLEDAFVQGYEHLFLYPVDTVLQHWSAIIVGAASSQVIRNGGFYPTGEAAGKARPEWAEAGRCRVYTADGYFLAAMRFNQERGQWHPQKVFTPQETVLESED